MARQEDQESNSGSGKPEDDIFVTSNPVLTDDRGVDDPLTHDLGDDNGVDDPLTHDLGDDNGVDDPLTHDLGDDSAFLFDAAYYLLSNPELVPTVGLDTALEHFLSSGAKEHRAPNSWFDAAYYADKWADLTPLHLDDATLFMHYNLYGVWEGRSGGPKLEHFDGERYLAENPDVAAYVETNLDDFLGSRGNGATAHFIIYGAEEHRLAYDILGVAIDLG